MFHSQVYNVACGNAVLFSLYLCSRFLNSWGVYNNIMLTFILYSLRSKANNIAKL